jgi:hypothetical protein
MTVCFLFTVLTGKAVILLNHSMIYAPFCLVYFVCLCAFACNIVKLMGGQETKLICSVFMRTSLDKSKVGAP